MVYSIPHYCKLIPPRSLKDHPTNRCLSTSAQPYYLARPNYELIPGMKLDSIMLCHSYTATVIEQLYSSSNILKFSTYSTELLDSQPQQYLCKLQGLSHIYALSLSSGSHTNLSYMHDSASCTAFHTAVLAYLIL